MRVLCCLLIFASIVPALSTYASQDQDTTTQSPSPRDIVEALKLLAKSTAAKNLEELQSDRLTIRQNEVFESIKRNNQKVRAFLQHTQDTVDIKQDLSRIRNRHTVAVSGIFTDPLPMQTYRNLETSYNILHVLARRLNVRKEHLDKYHNDLVTFRYEQDSIAGDSALLQFPKDSITLKQYVQKLVVLAYEVAPVDSALKAAIESTLALQNELDLEAYHLATDMEIVAQKQRVIAEGLLRPDMNALSNEQNQTSTKIKNFSVEKSMLALRFYIGNTTGKIFLLVLLIALSAYYLYSLKDSLRKAQLLKPEEDLSLVLRYPFLSAWVIVVNIFQFIFIAPPFAFNALLWISCGLALTIVFYRAITAYWLWVWLTILALFTAACAINLSLQPSMIELWMIRLVSGMGGIIGLWVYRRGKHTELQEKWIKHPIGLMVILLFLALLSSLFDRYNLSKTLLLVGCSSVVIALLFLWTIRLINEGLTLASNVFTDQKKALFYINYNRVGERAPMFFYVFLLIGWFILVGRNFYAFRHLSEPVQQALDAPRTIGDFTFTINSLLVFIAIMLGTMIIAKIVSYFATDQQQEAKAGANAKIRMGSWLLLIRIGIVLIGMLLAFAAAGVPMERVTIILGALGVGIGFGLQALVNNLVSGLIIAFEKPVNLGDMVEVSGQAGVIKSIGFRSSVISTYDGANIIIPNGDLLSSHVTNWTMGGSRRRMLCYR